ncbi:MAG: ParB N-terminal domain-containing protein [bacterium]|nr:ParB N-terminal domain-containing protein [bacterium]
MTEYKTESKSILLSSIQEISGIPQEWTDGDFQGLAASMERKGWYFAKPTVWKSKDKYICIDGPWRIKAAIQAGIKKTRCNIITDTRYTEEQARKDALEADSRRGFMDDTKLAEYILSLEKDFDIDPDSLVDLGIDPEKIKSLLSIEPALNVTDFDESIVDDTAKMLIIEFKNELEMKKLYDDLSTQGYQCRIIA